MNKQFTNKETGMPTIYVKRRSILLVIRECNKEVLLCSHKIRYIYKISQCLSCGKLNSNTLLLEVNHQFKAQFGII